MSKNLASYLVKFFMIVHAYIWPKYVRNNLSEMRSFFKKKMHRNDITIVCRKIWRFKQKSVSFS